MLKVILIIVGVLLLLLVGDIFYEINTIAVSSYTLKSSKIKGKLRLVQLTDLHGKLFGKNGERLLEKIDRIKPDGVVITGDMITAKKDRGHLKERDAIIAAMLCEIARKYPLYYSYGNHEQKISEQEKYGDRFDAYVRELSKGNVRLLKNESIYLDKYNVKLNALMIDHSFFRRFKLPVMKKEEIERCLGTRDEKAYELVLAHYPDYFKVYADWGADLVLSGHNHGGIARLPFLGGVLSPRCILFPKYDAGLFEEGKSTLILGRGLGTHTIPVRFLNRAELVEIVLEEK